ncbi:hypothetical protein PR002_g28366 [Phytophthora rubi]|uniref:Uncharacterized protein n=1 Tax=Phytophthora rubi TaxID=129364 RepID=A0A6A3HB20_9STRA|nr:hypothetical protein PR002_g28366 [Phytophthora rubi]
MRKVFSDWSSLVVRIADAAAKAGCEVTPNVTDVLADKMRKLRVSELSVGTALRLARQGQKYSHTTLKASMDTSGPTKKPAGVAKKPAVVTKKPVGAKKPMGGEKSTAVKWSTAASSK